MIDVIEQNIIDRLQTNQMFKGMDIEPFPADFNKYNFTSALGCLLVKYNGEDFNDPETIGSTVQTDTYSFTIFLGLRGLTKLNEAHPLITEIKDLLTGYQINGKKLYPVSIKYYGKINYSDNFWGLTFKLKLPSASKYDEDKVVPFWAKDLVLMDTGS